MLPMSLRSAAPPFAALAVLLWAQDPAGAPTLAPGGAFLTMADRPLARLRGGDIDTALYATYVTAVVGDRHLADLAFDLALARECAARGLARTAPVLARSAAVRRQHELGRDVGDHWQRCVFANEALRDQRVEALVRADRRIDPAEVQALFERRYGPGGVRVRARHLLVGFAGVQRALRATGAEATETAVDEAARARAAAERLRWQEGAVPSAAKLLDAGLLRRFGAAVGEVLQQTPVGEVSAPVRGRRGYHLVEVLGRERTALADVEAALRAELRASKPSPVEVRQLRQRLLSEYGFEPR